MFNILVCEKIFWAAKSGRQEEDGVKSVGISVAANNFMGGRGSC
jgi:hypothetical protein